VKTKPLDELSLHGTEIDVRYRSWIDLGERDLTTDTHLFTWLISPQPSLLFSHNKSASSNQPAVLFSQNKTAPAISHQPNEQAYNDTAKNNKAEWIRIT
jgi:hypothetical protein